MEKYETPVTEDAASISQSFDFGLIACALAFIPAQAQKESPHHDDKTSRAKREQATDEKKRQVIYSCPMHPTVKAEVGSRCPKCGMNLRRRHVMKKRQQMLRMMRPLQTQRFVRRDTATRSQLSKMNIPDIEVLDQNGKKIHFYTDLVKGQTVAINFIFTTCTTICPPLGATFARVQKELGDKVGRDVRFISISVDPATDTPERLKAWGAKFHAGDGWTFVTGNKPQVDELLRALGASSASREDHSPTILIGNDAHGVGRVLTVWRKRVS